VSSGRDRRHLDGVAPLVLRRALDVPVAAVEVGAAHQAREFDLVRLRLRSTLTLTLTLTLALALTLPSPTLQRCMSSENLRRTISPEDCICARPGGG
jgi:hypothetical protein